VAAIRARRNGCTWSAGLKWHKAHRDAEPSVRPDYHELRQRLKPLVSGSKVRHR
jgi:hypothetical protein